MWSLFSFRISRDEVKPILESLLSNLFKTFEIQGSEENEYVMKGKMSWFLIQFPNGKFLFILLDCIVS